jgi:lipopolysaccharide transport system ATP-binding protein
LVFGGSREHEKDLQMSSDDLAIQVSGLSKCYHLYDKPQDRLKESILPRIQRLIRTDPKHYAREFWALRDVSFELRKGETVGIIGRNGSGKSTLLQVICRTLFPTQGTLTTSGRIAALLELGSGFNPEFTGRENVYLNAAVLGLNRQEIEERFDDIVAFADIGQFIEQPVKTYSSGMYMRLAFAVIAHVNADILVIDEALSVGDAYFVQKCMRFLRNFMEHGTVLFVSHDTGAILNLCQRSILLNKGSIELMGPSKEVTAKYIEHLYESQQGKSLSNTLRESDAAPNRKSPVRDMRSDFINRSKYRNDIELFAFSSSAPSFGKKWVRIVSVQLFDENQNPLSWVVGGEYVGLRIVCKANEPVYSPIVGFMVKDRLGQVIFADNTYLTYSHQTVSINDNECFEAIFEFQMPVMPVGDYAIAVAVADGTQQDHVQHHWIHEALMFKVHSSMVCFGLIGLPMSRIEMRKL